MRGLMVEVNEFFSSTSIHGFPYISHTQSRSTRIIWTLIVIAALGGASYFLYQTVKGFDEKYVSTTIETRSIQDYPFPAITFLPGEYNSKNNFLRTFLNQFEFTRYSENSNLRDNDNFLNLYFWLISNMKNDFFKDVEHYLTNEKLYRRSGSTHIPFLQAKKNLIKSEACALVALHQEKVYLEKEIRVIFESNMFKFYGFKSIMTFMKQHVGSMIKEATYMKNLTNSEITRTCKDKKNEKTKTRMESLLLLYMFLFIDEDNSEVGAGDLATGPYSTGISRGDRHDSDIYHLHHYIPSHTLLTNMYNKMVNGSLPVSVLEFPTFFMLPPNKHDKAYENSYTYIERDNMNVIQLKNRIEFLNISNEALRNYHYHWHTYNNFTSKFTLFCYAINANCSTDLMKYNIPEQIINVPLNSIRTNPEIGKIVEGEVSAPPCSKNETIKKLKLDKICSFIKNISENKEAFLKLMKFSKQSPVYLEKDEEYTSIFRNESIAEFGFTSIDNKV